MAAQRHGSTRIPLPAAIAQLDPDRLDGLVGRSEEDFRPLLAIDGWLYHQRALHYERSLALRMRSRMRALRDAEGLEGLEELINDVVATGQVALSDEQRAAVATATVRAMTVITGGPGTGKTTIVVSLLRVLVRLGVAPDRIALAAPTGKAAHRLGESIAEQLNALKESSAGDAQLRAELPPPQTLHRLLRYSPGRGQFLRDEHDPIPARWVIVDEASMIDLMLMERLVRCLPAETNLVLLGDAEQLPSVETGAVLRDVIGDGGPHVVRLRSSFRVDQAAQEGRAILTLADAIRTGSVEAVQTEIRKPPGPGVRFIDVPAPELRARLLSFTDDWFDHQVVEDPQFIDTARRTYVLEDGRFRDDDVGRIDGLVAQLERSRVLCLTRVLPTGADALNASFHLRMARQSRVDGVPDYLAGEPVMVLRNDYRRQLFNGDQGIALWVESDDIRRLCAVFPTADGYVAYHLSALAGRLAHSWAMTVHKSQGSEFDNVAVILPREDLPLLLSRELLYTAVTRARRSVTIFGPAELFAAGVGRVLQRWSGLAERLTEEAGTRT
jgi:exodeoxyribonuclease V alpha subunit